MPRSAVPAEPNRPSDLNLHQKLCFLQAEIGSIEKDGTAPEKMGGWSFISHAKLMGILRGKLKEYGIFVKPSQLTASESRVGDKGIRVVGEYEFTLINADNPTEEIVCRWFGEGIDYGDKAMQKAGTSAHKYFLFKVLNVSDKDDSDGATIIESRSDPVARPEAPELSDEQARLSELARSLPKSKGAPSWFGAKIEARVRYHGGGRKGVEGALRELEDDHRRFCGDGCVHLAPQDVDPALIPDSIGSDYQ